MLLDWSSLSLALFLRKVLFFLNDLFLLMGLYLLLGTISSEFYTYGSNSAAELCPDLPSILLFDMNDLCLAKDILRLAEFF